MIIPDKEMGRWLSVVAGSILRLRVIGAAVSMVWLFSHLWGIGGELFAAETENRIMPFLEVENEFSDNYFRSEEDKTAVLVTRVSPGIAVDASTERSRLALDYRLNAVLHTDSKEDLNTSKDDYIGHDLTLSAATGLGTRFTTGVEEEYFLTREPASSDRFNVATTRDRYWRNRVRPFLSYDLGERGEVGLAYRLEMLDYIDTEDPGNEGSMENRGILTLTYHLSDINHLALEGQYWHRNYEGEVSDYDSFQGRLILRRDIGEWLTGELSGGYHARSYAEASLTDWQGAVFKASLTGQRDISAINLSLEHNINDFTQGDAYFVSWRATANVVRLFYEDFRVRLGGYYQFSDYQESRRNDSLWNIFAGVGYKFLRDMIEISLQYSYSNLDSNVEGYDFKEQRIFVMIRGMYDTSRQ